MEAKAKLSMIRISPRKMRLVADTIRNKAVLVAVATLKNLNKDAAEPILKLLNSAVANAVNNNGMEADKLYVKTIFVNEGPTLKRFRPRAHGRAYEIFKRTSHVVIVVSDEK
ncbi:50S ribosomal protein L22 [Mycoplasma mycoides subsp. mycoides]|uniref:Large ribosomal subunit protein uL22 n=2 Tax=Mycoplasma mycoides subsp. mycoides TaxID=2103 RepID=RL22_MYCMS|nr:50S ribosomal protein L22 [Mycoplasma mycoides]Q6MSN0.1 RecName: Full=Large ribosomal subunit protein uL22; AltName: Full=50S ribosomal protein L22 [Mycoplasma mycoides subsp. mycoides SC str. PG1]ADK69915.1 ribosomal protein L22 [Mycoplasma mycoides subsp. mycoides SC str. Gladysdale]AIZ55601.1 50S ribosomal protein L22 [Mycoplasma mycoides subsp. mycoides]AME10935.1 50S ribosomal protein L22 [Mycoplasma mycoides subsp. mycoides]AME11946.1 50S ribosomal protein L22 [Mycoplasma mycoides sub